MRGDKLSALMSNTGMMRFTCRARARRLKIRCDGGGGSSSSCGGGVSHRMRIWGDSDYHDCDSAVLRVTIITVPAHTDPMQRLFELFTVGVSGGYVE